jgi:glutathione synthase/RimK-type ligase-like ATP-grasp enzyme
MPIEEKRPLAIYYEHPDWFRPLFAELDRRDVPYDRIDASRHGFDPASRARSHDVVFNRMSPSAYLRGNARTIFYTREYLAHLERQGVRVINGTRAWATETSKVGQLALLQSLGLPSPRARVINDIAEAPGAAAGLRFPIVIKPNIGGSGAGVRRFDSARGLAAAAASGALELGIDHTALVQEFIPQASGRIVRVEVLNGGYLYAIRIYTTGETFNLCPGDVCHGVDGAELERAACPVDAPRNGLRVESYTPPREIIDAVERITHEAGIEIGGVEYFIDERDGELYFYDINALSNFVAEPARVIGFDPFARLVDWLEEEVARAGALVQEVA